MSCGSLLKNALAVGLYILVFTIIADLTVYLIWFNEPNLSIITGFIALLFVVSYCLFWFDLYTVFRLAVTIIMVLIWIPITLIYNNWGSSGLEIRIRALELRFEHIQDNAKSFILEYNKCPSTISDLGLKDDKFNDPFTGEPLDIREHEGQCIIYSLGPNRRKDSIVLYPSIELSSYFYEGQSWRYLITALIVYKLSNNAAHSEIDLGMVLKLPTPKRKSSDQEI